MESAFLFNIFIILVLGIFKADEFCTVDKKKIIYLSITARASPVLTLIARDN